MLYDFIEFRNTMIKLYYRTDIENNENTAVVSNDEQMLSDEKKSSNDQKKTTDQPSELHDTEINAVALSTNTLNAATPSANAPNATAPDALSRAKSEKTLQSSSIKRGRDRSQKQSIIQLKNQPNLSIFLSNKINSLVSSLRISYAKSKKKSMNY